MATEAPVDVLCGLCTHTLSLALSHTLSHTHTHTHTHTRTHTHTHADLLVSRCCLGTMTWGQQNSLEEGVEQLNVAVEVKFKTEQKIKNK